MVEAGLELVTLGELHRRWRVPLWRLRETVDRLYSAGEIHVRRAGRYRMLAPPDVEKLKANLAMRQLLPLEVQA